MTGVLEQIVEILLIVGAFAFLAMLMWTKVQVGRDDVPEGPGKTHVYVARRARDAALRSRTKAQKVYLSAKSKKLDAKFLARKESASDAVLAAAADADQHIEQATLALEAVEAASDAAELKAIKALGLFADQAGASKLAEEAEELRDAAKAAAETVLERAAAVEAALKRAKEG